MPYYEPGTTVRVTSGPLKGIEGVVQEAHGDSAVIALYQAHTGEIERLTVLTKDLEEEER